MLAALQRPVDVAWLAAFRFLFGVAMCVSMLRFIGYGWIDDFFVKPTFHFKYWGFAWVSPWSPTGMHVLFWVLAALALATALGIGFRVSAALFTLGFTYLQLIDVATYLNHYYLACLLSFLLAVSPAGRAWSIDAWLRPHLRVETVPAFWLYLFRLQVTVVYTSAGLAKANADWLLHAQPLRIWLGSRTGLPILGPFLAIPWAAVVMSWAGFLFDTTIAWFLMFRRTRAFAYVVVIVFHVLTRILFPIGMFPAIMILAALVFFSPDWPRRLGARLRLLQHAGAASGMPSARPARRISTAGLVLACAYCLVQVVLPFRFRLYGGNVLWHEQGMRFSWRVMVREKNGSVAFQVRNKATGRQWLVTPRTYLTTVQERELSGQPDLILQLAHHIRDDFERRGDGPVEVRAEALVSLNGRKIANLIDPTVDLSAVEDGVGPAPWILPGPAEQPPHIRPVGALGPRRIGAASTRPQ